MKIGSVDLRDEVFVIAEIGNNHEGDFALAVKLIELAAQCGVHAVKFQTIRPERFVAKSNEARFQQLTKYEFSDTQFAELARIASEQGLVFLSTPFDLESADMLDALMPAFKIASGDNNFYPLLERVASMGKPILLSTGLADLDQVKRSIEVIGKAAAAANVSAPVIPLHCVCAYPTPTEQANLGAIQLLSDELQCIVGYSDHTLGINAAVLSVGLGARVIEKHFTIDKNHSSFRDHQLSADPAEMKLLVERVKEANQLLGTGEKRLQAVEQSNVAPVRRSIVAKHDLPAGTVIKESDLCWMRPSGGLAPGEEHRVVGKKLLRAVLHGEQIVLDNLV